MFGVNSPDGGGLSIVVSSLHIQIFEHTSIGFIWCRLSLPLSKDACTGLAAKDQKISNHRQSVELIVINQYLCWHRSVKVLSISILSAGSWSNLIAHARYHISLASSWPGAAYCMAIPTFLTFWRHVKLTKIKIEKTNTINFPNQSRESLRIIFRRHLGNFRSMNQFSSTKNLRIRHAHRVRRLPSPQWTLIYALNNYIKFGCQSFSCQCQWIRNGSFINYIIF